MRPWADEGDYLLAWPCAARRLRPGQVVVASHPRLGMLVKRIVACDGRQITLAGDDAASTPSAVIGALPVGGVAGRVLWRIRAPREPRNAV